MDDEAKVLMCPVARRVGFAKVGRGGCRRARAGRYKLPAAAIGRRRACVEVWGCACGCASLSYMRAKW